MLVHYFNIRIKNKHLRLGCMYLTEMLCLWLTMYWLFGEMLFIGG